MLGLWGKTVPALSELPAAGSQNIKAEAISEMSFQLQPREVK